MIRVKTEKFDLFNGVFSFCFADNHEEVQDYYKSEVFDDIEDANGLASILQFRGRATYALIIVQSEKDKLSLGIIAHEAIHLAQYICDRIGYQALETEDEIYSHLTSFITNRYIAFLKTIGKFELFI